MFLGNSLKNREVQDGRDIYILMADSRCCVASGPITAWQIEGEKVEVVTGFLFLGSKITVDRDRRQ